MKIATGRTFFIIAAALVAVFFLFEGISKVPDTNKPEQVTIARTGGIPSSFFWIAEHQGYFRDEHLDVSYLDFDQGPPALSALRERRADITSSGELPIVRSILEGDRIFILAELVSDFGINIIARKDRGIHSPADLAGKKIGVTKGTVNEFQLLSLLEVHGVSEQDVTLIDIPFTSSVETFTSGAIDAISGRQTAIAELEKQFGDQGIVFSTEGIYTFRFLLVGNQDFVNQHPDATEKIIRALVRAETFLRENSAQARAITAEYMKADLSTIEETWPRYRFLIHLSQPIFITLEDEARWLIVREPIGSAVPNFLDYMYFDALQSVKPDSISVPH